MLKPSPFMVQKMYLQMVIFSAVQPFGVTYASRGLKMRLLQELVEVQMEAEGKSMLCLEARCLYITKAAGVQGHKIDL